jgi:hypothetical protein
MHMQADPKGMQQNAVLSVTCLKQVASDRTYDSGSFFVISNEILNELHATYCSHYENHL